MEILIDTKFLAHDGGTKFYEVNQFYNVDVKRFVLVNRWGKMTEAKNGGGQTKIQHYGDIRKCQDDARKKIAEKQGRGYAPQSHPDFGLHNIIAKQKSDEILRAHLANHYALGVVEGVIDGLGIPDEIEALPEGYDEDDVINEEPLPEPVRGEDWASW